jgi:aspartate racemase
MTTLGVLGGMGPAATAEFLRVLAARVPASRDQDHPRTLVLSEPAIPDRTEALLAGDETPLAAIRDGLATLVGWGADLLAVPCNAAHVYVDRLLAELPVPLVHIVTASLAAARDASPEGAWLTATTGTVASGIYQRYARAAGYRLVVPPDGPRRRADAAAVLVKANRVAEAAEEFAAVVRELRAELPLPVLTACTELPIAYHHAGLPAAHQVSSIAALAGACVDALYPVPAGGVR